MSWAILATLAALVLGILIGRRGGYAVGYDDALEDLQYLVDAKLRGLDDEQTTREWRAKHGYKENP